MQKKYTIGIDYGTLSARAVALDLATGEEVTEAVFVYPHAVMDRELPSGKKLPAQFALQHPQDYLDALKNTIGGVLKTISKEEIVGICIDFTTCTMLPVDEQGTPLCFHEAFADDPHAYVKMWKHHGPVKQARRFDEVAAKRKEPWMANCGGTSSSEWVFPKILETIEEAPAVFEATHRFYEAADWLSLLMTGKETHNICMVGLKGFWDEKTGYPSNEFFCEVDSRLDGIVGTKVCPTANRVDELAGYINEAGAALTGLCPGTPVAMPIGDAHASLPGLNITSEGSALLLVGTSGILQVNTPEYHVVPGICSLVYGGIYPDSYTIEAGQASVGDSFDWCVKNCVPASYQEEAKQKGVNIHVLLQEKASRLRPGESRLLAMEWFNGNRSILKNDNLSGMILGLSLQTRPEEIYRALIEATAYGLRVIIDNYETHGVKINSICAAGGIAFKSPMLMQLYADIFNREITLGHSAQSAARGSAIYAAVAAGECSDIISAAARYAQPVLDTYYPNAENAKIYDALYREYKKLHDYFGRGENGVMDRLYDIYAMGADANT